MKMIILPNGLRVVVLEMNHLHSCEVGLYIKVGGMNDPKGKEGLSHFVEHMLFRGTKSYASERIISKEFEKVGGLANAATDEEVTCYHTQYHPSKTDEVLEILSSITLDHLLLDFQTEKSVVKQEIKEAYNDRRQLIDEEEVLRRLMWRDHPLGSSVAGTLKSVHGIKLNDIRNHIDTYYKPDNAVLVVAGRVVAEEFFTLAEKHFTRWEGKSTGREVEEFRTNQTEPTCEFVYDCSNQLQICIGFRGFSRKDKRMSPSQFLGFTMSESSSGMYSSLRLEKGLVYSVYAKVEEFPTTGAFIVNLLTEPANFEKALDAAFEEIVAIASKPLEDEDFTRFQNSYIFEMDYGLDKPSHMNMRYGYGVSLDHIRSLEEDKEMIASMTSEQICNVARTIFDPKNLNIVVIGPYKKKEKQILELAIQKYKEKYNAI